MIFRHRFDNGWNPSPSSLLFMNQSAGLGASPLSELPVLPPVLLVAVVIGVAAFCFKEELFAVILAPKDADFVTYRLLYAFSSLVTEADAPDFLVKLINTGLAEQFIIHMKAALCAGILCASPYILYQLFHFVSPALYVNERKYMVRVVGSDYAMFTLGVAVSYFLIFPQTFRFLGTYQVSGEVENMIALQSYISTLMTMSLAMGLVFEISILSWLFAKLGLLSAGFMRKYRKYAIVVILVVVAIITSTSDVFTLSLVALPMWWLYEVSILIVNKTANKGPWTEKWYYPKPLLNDYYNGLSN